MLLPGRQKIGLLWTLALGVVGSVIGGTIANLIGTGDIFELNVIGFIAAVAASVACSPRPSGPASAKAATASA